MDGFERLGESVAGVCEAFEMLKMGKWISILKW
jgi:hypothetical protein